MKRLAIITFLNLICLLNSIGQDKRLSIGFIGGIDLNKYYFKETGFDYEYNSNVGYSYGLNFQYFMLNKAFIESGIIFTTEGYQLKYNYIFPDPGDPAIPRESELSLSFIKIPMMIGYQVMKMKKLRFNPSIGIDIDFLTKRKENTIYEDNSERESDLLGQNLNEILIKLKVSFGIDYHINERFKIALVPYFGKGLNKLDKVSMKTGELSYGGILGLYFKF